jgi:purine-binding chemotaxis protein CheW
MNENEKRQFISFTLGIEEYGVDIMAIREIKAWSPVTPLPEAPAHVRGVIDLRGTIVPIIDLRARFHNGHTDATATHVIIVVAVAGQMVGLLADAVADIVSVATADIQPVPDVDHTARHDYLTGLVSVEGRMVVLLDLDRLLGHEATLVATAEPTA